MLPSVHCVKIVSSTPLNFDLYNCMVCVRAVCVDGSIGDRGGRGCWT